MTLLLHIIRFRTKKKFSAYNWGVIFRGKHFRFLSLPPKGPSIYYVSIFLRFFDPLPLPFYVSIFVALKVSENCYYLKGCKNCHILRGSKNLKMCLRNILMAPKYSPAYITLVRFIYTFSFSFTSSFAFQTDKFTSSCICNLLFTQLANLRRVKCVYFLNTV